VTTVLPPAAQAEHEGPEGGPEVQAGGTALRKASYFARHPEWPIAGLLVLYPLWWYLGVASYIDIIIGIPMAVKVFQWRKTRGVKVPPGFGIWLLFLLVSVCGLVTLSLQAPGTLQTPVSHRVISWAARELSYGGVTAMLLYIGNLTERELPRVRLAWMLGLLGIYSVIGGIAGTIAPTVQFTSPLAYVVPQSQQSQQGDGLFGHMLHPALSQVQGFLGYAQGRPTAPFVYTNIWGNAIAILLPWLVVCWWFYGTRRQRRWLIIVMGFAFIPAVVSLNRGLWIAMGCMVLYVAVRLAARGKFALLGAVVAMIGIVVVVVLSTPLESLIVQRLQHGQSDNGRINLSLLATKAALASPLLGFGDTRHQQGSATSIAVGPSAACVACGSKGVGGNGQIWLLFVTSGFLGAGLYIAFFGYSAWRYRRDTTPYGWVGVMVLLLGFVFMFVYNAVGAPLDFTIIALGLLWRNDMELQRQRAELQQSTAPAPLGAGTGASALARG
jgi:hypothetical protein